MLPSIILSTKLVDSTVVTVDTVTNLSFQSDISDCTKYFGVTVLIVSRSSL